MQCSDGSDLLHDEEPALQDPVSAGVGPPVQPPPCLPPWLQLTPPPGLWAPAAPWQAPLRFGDQKASRPEAKPDQCG